MRQATKKPLVEIPPPAVINERLAEVEDECKFLRALLKHSVRANEARKEAAKRAAANSPNGEAAALAS